MRKKDLPNGIAPIVEMLKVLLRLRCEEHDVAPKLVATSDDLKQLAADDEADIIALTGWRRALFGADALALKRGELALCIADKTVKVLPVQTDD